MRQFKRVIYLFEEFENLLRKMACLYEEIKRKLKLRNFKNTFQITKIVKFEIRSKRRKLKFPKLLKCPLLNRSTSAHTNSIGDHCKKENHTKQTGTSKRVS